MVIRATRSLLTRKALWILLAAGIIAAALIVPIGALAADNDDAAPLAAAGLDSSAAATRAEFAMLAVTGLGLSPVPSSIPAFIDVPRGSVYYEYVEGAHLAGLVQGLGNGYYGPDLPIARQQVATILARYLSNIELQTFGYITGKSGTYATLAGWYAAEGEPQLARFYDRLSIATVHRPGVAYLVMHDIALGSNGYFSPLSSVTVAQCVAFVARTAEVADSFTTPVTPAPAVTSITPTSGSYLGGTAVTIYGTGFTAGATVKFGTSPATGVTVSNATTISAVSPAGTPGTTVQVSVTTTAGTSANTAADDFTYTAAPVPAITSLSAHYGWQGDIVHIYGSNFVTSGLQVWFGPHQVNSGYITYYDSTHLAVVVPAGYAGEAVSVSVVTSYGTSPNTSADDFTYYYGAGAPTITELDPDWGWGGDVVHIYGTNFIEGDTAVFFGNEQVHHHDIVFYTSTHIAVVVPGGYDGQTVRVRVVTAFGTSPNTAADDFTYVYGYGLPTITDLDPDHGWEGDTVHIYGTNFIDGDTAVFFGVVQVPWYDITYYGSTHLAVEVPEGTNGVTVRVRAITDYGTSPNTPADDFTYVLNADPIVSGVEPNHGWGGDIIHIHGSNFALDGLKVWFGGAPAGVLFYYDSTHLSVIAPPGYDGQTVRVIVATDYGVSPNTLGDEFTYRAPASEVYAIASVEWREGTGAWTAAPKGILANASTVDFRMQVVDVHGVPVVDTQLAGFSPWCGWYEGGYWGHLPGPGGGALPDTTVTDSQGYLYWTGLGGYSNTSYIFWVGLRTGTFTYLGQMFHGVNFVLTWAP